MYILRLSLKIADGQRRSEGGNEHNPPGAESLAGTFFTSN